MRDDMCTYATFTLNLDHCQEVIEYESFWVQVCITFRIRRYSLYWDTLKDIYYIICISLLLSIIISFLYVCYYHKTPMFLNVVFFGVSKYLLSRIDDFAYINSISHKTQPQSIQYREMYMLFFNVTAYLISHNTLH